MIERSWTVNETIDRVPASLPVLNSLGIDTCCGGGDTLDAAASRSGVDENVLLSALESVRRSDAGDPGADGAKDVQATSGGCACGCRKVAAS